MTIFKKDEEGNILQKFSSTKECSWDIFGDERQIQLAIAYKRMAYGFYWFIEETSQNKEFLQDFLSGKIRWEKGK